MTSHRLRAVLLACFASASLTILPAEASWRDAPQPNRVSLGPVATRINQGSMELRYSLSRPASVWLAVCDANGHVVQTLADGAMEPGEYTAVWDRCDHHGRPATNGAYLVVLRSGGQARSAMFILERAKPPQEMASLNR